MQTNFSLTQLADTAMKESEKILRSCVHCGFCTATCPTYLMLGDELDSPRGRIYLIKDMLEGGKAATQEVATHLDRCLSCLSCMTTCPSGVHYMHLVDHARAYVQETYKRPLADRLVRDMLAMTIPHRGRFRLAIGAAWLADRVLDVVAAVLPIRRVHSAHAHEREAGRVARRPTFMERMWALLHLAPDRMPNRSANEAKARFAAQGARRARVVLLQGCAQPVLRPEINDATIRLLTRNGVEVVTPKEEGCCGALVHHMGREHDAHAFAKNNIDVWTREIEGGGLDAILITASGCGTSIKDYGFQLRNDPVYAAKAARVSALAKDVTEFLESLDIKPTRATGQVVAYHSACSMQHGQKITDQPKRLLRAAGFRVKDVPEGHICCGSAGTYNMLQPELAARLRDRKVGNIARLAPDIIAAGNIGCMTQIGSAAKTPVVHTIELLDWANGGPSPEAISHLTQTDAAATPATH